MAKSKSAIDEVVLAALTKALKAPDVIPLTTTKNLEGLFKPAQKAPIKKCFEGSKPLLHEVRTEKHKQTTIRLVRITVEGVAYLLTHSPDSRTLIQSALDRHKNQLAALNDGLRDLTAQSAQTIAELDQTLRVFADQATNTATSLQKEIEGAQARAKGIADLLKQPPPPIPEGPSSTTPLEELAPRVVSAWKRTSDSQAKMLIESALFNSGVLERIGKTGSRVNYSDTGEHDCADDVDVGEEVEVVEPGWKLPTPQGALLLEPAIVKAIRTDEVRP